MLVSGKSSFAVAALVGLALTASAAAAPTDHAAKLQGTVQGGGTRLAGYKVSLYASFVDKGPPWKLLGSDTSDGAGKFQITYSLPAGLRKNPSILFVEAEHGLVMLASAIGLGSSAPENVVVNERTTVATGNAFAQFVDGRRIEGNTYGMINAAAHGGQSRQPADRSGRRRARVDAERDGDLDVRDVQLARPMSVASCVADADNCAKLFEAATPPGGAPPANVLQAVANIVKNPSYPGYPSNAEDPVFLLSQANPIYQPALTQRPTSWLLFLKITGGFYSAQDSDNLMNGPGNFAIDEQGFVWVNDNAVPQPPGKFACAGRRLLKFYPWGENFSRLAVFRRRSQRRGVRHHARSERQCLGRQFRVPGSALRACLKRAARHNSVSVFRPDGTPISGIRGYTNGDISWPQGTVSDREGNIWVANCGNDSVTMIPRRRSRSGVQHSAGTNAGSRRSADEAIRGCRRSRRQRLGHRQPQQHVSVVSPKAS